MVKASLLGTKKVIPSASWRNSVAVTFVPFADGIWTDPNRAEVTVAFVALSAVVTLPGGINTPLIWLMKIEPHCLELITVIF